MKDALRREEMILDSKVRDVFTPFSPIQANELLLGRQNEVEDLLACINTPGQHALIYGNRGIGKSSLAIIVADLSETNLGYSIHIKKCDSVDTFTSIMSEVLEKHGHDIHRKESINEHSKTGGAKAGFAEFGANVTLNNKQIDRTNHENQFASAGWAAKELKDSRSLIIIDEADAIKMDEDKLKIAEFVKHLSDYKSEFKVIIVGISSTGRDLVCNHRSIERCLDEISLRPINITELKRIITEGSKKVNINFDNDVIDVIVDISGGYPHYVHLIALKCAEEAIVNNIHRITPKMLPNIFKIASRFSDGRLVRTYEEAVSVNTAISKKVLLAAALCHPKGFLLSEVSEMTNQVVDTELTKGKITSCLSRWIKNEDNNIIKRVARGHYCFTDPRLLSYIKMINGFTYDKESIVADILRNEYSKRYV